MRRFFVMRGWHRGGLLAGRLVVECLPAGGRGPCYLVSRPNDVETVAEDVLAAADRLGIRPERTWLRKQARPLSEALGDLQTNTQLAEQGALAKAQELMARPAPAC